MFKKDSWNDNKTKTPEETKPSKPKASEDKVPEKSPKVTQEPKKDNSNKNSLPPNPEEENANKGKSLMNDLFENFVNKEPHYATRSGASDWLNYLDPERTGLAF